MAIAGRTGAGVKIERIDISQQHIDLAPPFPAAWDSRPRTRFAATVVRVITDEGIEGIGSGDAMHGFDDYRQLFIGHDPLDLERHYAILDNIAFHGARCWPLDIALWDLAGKIKQQPVYKLLGGTNPVLPAYASTGVLREPKAQALTAKRIAERGFKALKLRLGRPDFQDDLRAVEAVRAELGDDFIILIDANQGWRMPWDTRQPWDYARALAVAQALEPFGIYWLEEPLHRGDYAGMAALRKAVNCKIAGAEMTREAYEFRELLERQCLDVMQPDATLTGGITGLAKIARQALQKGVAFTPHTWGNGIGLLANAHLTAGVGGGPWLEFPYDPPEWTEARRDFLLAQAVEVDAEGNLLLADKPGLGFELK